MALLGTPILFNDGRCLQGSISRLSDDEYVIVYSDTDANTSKVVVCDRTYLDVSVGSGNIFINGSTPYLDADSVPTGFIWPSGDSDRIYAYGKDADGVETTAGWGVQKCGSVSGKTVVWGTPKYYMDNVRQDRCSLTSINSGHIGVSFHYEQLNQLRCYSADVDENNDITISAVKVAEAVAGVSSNQSQVIDSDNALAIVSYRHEQQTGGFPIEYSCYGKVRLIDYSASPPASYSSTEFFTPTVAEKCPNGMRICVLDPQTFVLGYSHTESPESGIMVVGSIIGTDISFGKRYAFAPGNCIPYISQQRIGDNRFIFTYSDVNDSYKGKWVVGEVSGTEISYVQSGIFSELPIYNDPLGSAQCTTLDSNVVAISYCQSGSASGYTVLLDINAVGDDSDLYIDGYGGISGSIYMLVHTGHTDSVGNNDLFIDGYESQSSSTDLVIYQPHEPTDNNAELFVEGNGSIIVDAMLYVGGVDVVTTDIPLTIYGQQSHSQNISLFINPYAADSDYVDCFVSGKDNTNNSVQFVIPGKTNEFSNTDLLINSHLSTSGYFDIFEYGFDVSSGSGDLVLPLTHGIYNEIGELYVGGLDVNNKNFDAYVYGKKVFNNSVDLVVPIVRDVLSSQVDCYVCGVDTDSASADMYLYGDNTISTSLDLFIDGFGNISDTVDLFVQSEDNTNIYGQITLIIYGISLLSTSGDLYIKGSLTESATLELCIAGQVNRTDSCDLYVGGYDTQSESTYLYTDALARTYNDTNLFTTGYRPDYNQHDLVVGGYNFCSGSVNLFTFGESQYINVNTWLYLHGKSVSYEELDLYINGINLVTNSADLFITGSGTGMMSDNMSLFINGYEPIEPPSCPILDPTSAIQIKDELITTYQRYIDSLVNQLGKNVYLEFDPIQQMCPNCEYDTLRKRSTGIYRTGGPRPFDRGKKCPYCKGRGFIETPVNKCIKCLIKWNPKDANNFGISVSKTKGIVRLKTYLTEADDLSRARTVLVNHDIKSQLHLRVRLLRGPIPVGLREDRYCISFWELV